MMPKYLILAVLVCVLSTQKTSAQGKDLPVEVVVDKLSHKNIRGFLEKTVEATFKFYNDDISPENNITNKCLVLKSTDKEKAINTADDISLSSLRTLKQFKINPGTGVISIKMESFKNDKGEPCEFDKGDNYHSVVSLDVKLSELNPGVFSAQLPFIAKDDKFAASVRIRYGIPAPAAINPEGIDKVNDPSKSITLKSLLDLANKTNLNFVWEYKTDDDNNWKELGKTTTETFVFSPAKDVFKKTIKASETIHLRMKAMSTEISGPYSATCDILFTPPAPQFDKNEVTTVATCPNSPSGSVSIKTISGIADNLAYYIIKGKTLEATEYPDVIEQNKKVFSGTVTNNKPLSVQKLEEGDYTIVVYNASMQVGKMFTTHSFSVKKIANLAIKSESVTEATCGNIPDGQILIEIEGGSPGKLVTTITPNTGKVKQFSRNIVFSELPAGSYTVFIKDECSQTIATKELEITKKTVQIKGKVDVESEPLNNFSNGSVKVSLEGGSGQYKYILTKGTVARPEKTVTASPFMIDNISKGIYKLKIIDMSLPLCPGWDTTFNVTGKTLVADTTETPSVKKDTTVAQPEKKDTVQHQIAKQISEQLRQQEYLTIVTILSDRNNQLTENLVRMGYNHEFSIFANKNKIIVDIHLNSYQKDKSGLIV